MGLDAVTEAEDVEIRAVVVSKLTPEESEHEAEAVKEAEAPAAPASKDEEAIAEEVAASADEGPDPSDDRLDFSDDDTAMPNAADPEPASAKGKPRPVLARKPAGSKLPEKPIGLAAKQAKPAALGARLRARKEGDEKKSLPAKPGSGGLLNRKKD